MTPFRWTYHHSAAVVLVFVAVMMSAVLSRTVFERLPHLEDEIAYLFQAKVFASGRMTADIIEPRGAFWQPFVVEDQSTGQRAGKYTPGWSLVLAAGVVGGSPFLVNALFAGLTVALVFRLGARAYSPDAGLIAAILVTFSPAALLLNASLMGHTVALFCATLFYYAYLEIQTNRHPLRWGVLAGVALGVMVITRPLTALGVAAPLIVWSGIRLLRVLVKSSGKISRPAAFWQTLKPLVLLSVFTLLIAALIPIYNYTATGEAGENLYTRIWSYDRIGFGECCGRNGHTLQKAFRHTRFDLSLTAVDLFGWQLEPLTDDQRQHLLIESDYYPGTGYSFLLLIPGIFAGVLWGASGRWHVMRRGVAVILWLIVAAGWCHYALNLPSVQLIDPSTGWAWVLGALGIVLLPLLIFVWRGEDKRAQVTWLLLGWMLCVVILQFTYWIGSQRYSTRYYYEALVPAAMLSALPLAWAAGRWRGFVRGTIYVGLLLVTGYALVNYSLPRIDVLHRFNTIGTHDLVALEQRREPGEKVLVMVTGPSSGDDRVRWRALGTFMAVSDPFGAGDIVTAWNTGDQLRDELLARFPDRRVIELSARGNEAEFIDPPLAP